MRYALKFGYHGRYFSGYAIQPDVRTVEGDIMEALKRAAFVSDRTNARFQTASRTDKGVSALGNVLALDTDFRKEELLGALNAHLEGIWFYGIAAVPPEFNPRHARQRWYRYHLADEDWETETLRDIAQVFQGKHDFSNFARLEGNDPVRTLDSIEVFREGDIVVLDFKAQSFLWHMVRRLVKAVTEAALGNISKHDIENALAGGQNVDFGLAPPEPLVLMNVKYEPDIEVDKGGASSVASKLQKNAQTVKLDTILYENMLRLVK